MFNAEAVSRFFDECQTVLMVRTDGQGRITDGNSAFCRLLSMTDLPLGRKLEDFLLPESAPALHQAAQKGHPGCRVGLVAVNNLIHTVQCRLFPDEEGLLIIGEKPVFSGADIFSEMSSMNDDLVNLTRELKEKNALLEETTEKLQTLFSAAPLGVVVWDRKHRIRVWNPAAERIFGWTAEELQGQSIPYTDEAMRQQLKTMIEGAFQGEVIDDIELARHDKEGRKLELVGALSPVRRSDGSITEVIEIVADVTERRQAERRQRQWEQQMQELQKLESLSALAGGVAHDFNNLLMIISGNADLGLMDARLSDDLRELLQEIKDASTRAATLSNQMRAYSGRGHAAVEPLNLNDVIGAMEPLLRALAGHRITLDLDLAENLPELHADRTQMDQLAVNLVTNAAEAVAGQGGRIVVRTAREDWSRPTPPDHATGEELPAGSYVVLEVSDTGCGISDQEVRRVFEPFFSTKFIGRGLGLAAVQGIVRGHQGGVFVRSQSGEGTAFRVLLPLPASAGRPGLQQPGAEASWRGRGRILLADDEQAVRMVAQRLLERLGFEVQSVADGHEALQAFQVDPSAIQCLMLDWSMPGMQGPETLDRFRHVRPDLPIILCSGYGEARAKDFLQGKQRTAFLEKPFELHVLTDVLKKLLGQETPAASGRDASA
jgi:two-component system, cell cycle sensor histidine kinase and response regulator CckA